MNRFELAIALRRARPWGAALAALVALALAPRAPLSARAHPFHVSRGWVAYNREVETLEISLCVFPDDLAAALKRQTPPTAEAKDPHPFDDAAHAYIRQVFRLRAGSDQLLPIEWVGSESVTQQTWLHFEIPLAAERLPQAVLQNAVFFELFDDQVNDTFFQLDGRQWTRSFTSQEPQPRRLIPAEAGENR